MSNDEFGMSNWLNFGIRTSPASPISSSARATYTESGGQGNPTYDTKQAIAVMHEKHGIACDMMHGFTWDKWTTGTPTQRLQLIPAGQEHILEQEDGGKKRWVRWYRNSALTARDMTAIPAGCQSSGPHGWSGIPGMRAQRRTHRGVSPRAALLNPGYLLAYLRDGFPSISRLSAIPPKKSEEPCPRLQLGRSAAFTPLHRPEAAGQWFAPCRSDVEAA